MYRPWSHWKTIVLALVLALNVGLTTANWEQETTVHDSGIRCGSCWS